MCSRESMPCICGFRQKSGAHSRGRSLLGSPLVRLLSEVALILRCRMARPCFTAQFLPNFMGLHNFPPAVSHYFWLLSICQRRAVLLTWPPSLPFSFSSQRHKWIILYPKACYTIWRCIGHAHHEISMQEIWGFLAFRHEKDSSPKIGFAIHHFVHGGSGDVSKSK